MDCSNLPQHGAFRTKKKAQIMEISAKGYLEGIRLGKAGPLNITFGLK